VSTRACYRFIPQNGPNDWPGVVTVYKHSDGYPRGAAEAIERAIPHAWKLPRFEADEFAAAFVRGNKMSAEDHAREYEAYAAKASDTDKPYLLETARKYRTDPGYRSIVGGGIRLVPFEGIDAHKRFACDTEYLYDIRCVDGKLLVTAYTTSERDGQWTIEKFFEGSTKQLARRKP
jgi:hypothetical protein